MQHEIPCGTLSHILSSLPHPDSYHGDIIRFNAGVYDHTCIYLGGDTPADNLTTLELTFVRKMTPHGYEWHLLV